MQSRHIARQMPTGNFFPFPGARYLHTQLRSQQLGGLLLV